ncbi:MAG: hypothetical protein K0R73_238 [Candidatus Midichloriaceae bacterium]|jgi:hypothetical protein|nr:hypothetical protein [Candidatus Midichloriaceae bacterium]
MRQYTLTSENLSSSEPVCRPSNFKKFKESLLEEVRVEKILDYTQSQSFFACIESLEKGYHAKLEQFLKTIKDYRTRQIENISQNEKAKLYHLEACFTGAIIMNDKDAVLLIHLHLQKTLFQESVSRMLPLILKFDSSEILDTLIDISHRGSAFKKSLVELRILYFLNFSYIKDLDYQISNYCILTYLSNAEMFDAYCPSYIALIKNLGLTAEDNKLIFEDKFFYLDINIQLLATKVLIKQLIRDPLGSKTPATIKESDTQDQFYKILLYDTARRLSVINVCLDMTFYECMRLIRCVEQFHERLASKGLIKEFLQTANPRSKNFRAFDIAKQNDLASISNIADIIKLSMMCCIGSNFNTKYPVDGGTESQLAFIGKFCKIIIKDVVKNTSINSLQECNISMA